MTLSNNMKAKRILRAKTPRFKLHAFHRKSSLSESWRKPRGLHNKQKDNKKGSFPRVKSGYRVPADVRGLHSSGLAIVRVSNLAEVDTINPKIQAAVIASVGAKRQLALLDACSKKSIRVLNHKTTERVQALHQKHDAAKAASEAARKAKAENTKQKDVKKPMEDKVSDEEKKDQEKKIKEEVLTHK